jgi:ribose transport system substrate-binding protein
MLCETNFWCRNGVSSAGQVDWAESNTTEPLANALTADMKQSSRSRYVVKSLVHASEVLGAFHSRSEVLRLRDIVERTGFNKGMCFRLLYTLHSCGFIEKVGGNQYRVMSETLRKRRFRIGYASQGQPSSFPREVQAGLIQAARDADVELVIADNRYDPKVALRSADQLIREEVDLVIEFQTNESIAPAIAAKYLEAGIPIIAIDVPHPGATFFGANNYEAGLIGGRHLGRWAAKHWHGTVDEVLLIELVRAGSVPQARMRGTLAGIHDVLPLPDSCRILHLDGDGQFGPALHCVRRHLRLSRAKHFLVGAANDPSALGALRAFQEIGRALDCAVVGHNAEPEGRAELREEGTRLIGSVAYFPERYGPSLIRLALEILEAKRAPSAVFIKHQLITPENVDHYYPNDKLLALIET